MSLTIAGVPIGNPMDASARLVAAINAAEIVAAEDSRKFQRLCQDLSIKYSGKVISYFDGNETDRIGKLIDELKAGLNILLVTDAGMPAISDPGYLLVESAISNGIEVQVIPGPSAVTTALAISGLPSERFIFEGFLPRTESARDKAIEDLRFEERTLVFFEAPHRIIETLESFTKIFGAERTACICRELTKTHEEIIRGNLNELLDWANSKEMLGEFTLVISGAKKDARKISNNEVVELVKKYEAAGMDRKEAIAEVAKLTGLPKRNVFSAMVDAKSPLD